MGDSNTPPPAPSGNPETDIKNADALSQLFPGSPVNFNKNVDDNNAAVMAKILAFNAAHQPPPQPQPGAGLTRPLSVYQGTPFNPGAQPAGLSRPLSVYQPQTVQQPQMQQTMAYSPIQQSQNFSPNPVFGPRNIFIR